MSFSSNIKEEFNKVIPNNKELLKYEILGYLLSGNTKENKNEFIYSTENEFNIERFYKILFRLNINYEPNKESKNYEAVIEKSNISDEIFSLENIEKEEFAKALVRGAFLGGGSVNNPESKYHLEIGFNEDKKASFISNVCLNFGITLKKLEKKNKIILYIKEGEEISNFLAFIGANQAVLKFEEIRVVREIKNNVNRKVNCESANLNKTINAALEIIDDIKLIKKKKKFGELDKSLQELANLREENPEMPLKELGNSLSEKVGKSGVKYRLDKIHQFAEELKM